MRKVFRGIFSVVFAVLTVAFVGISVKAEAAAKLPAPKITGKTSSADSATIEWEPVSGADGYIIYKYNSSKKKYKSCGNISKTMNNAGASYSYEITGLKSEKTYKFKVAAYVLKSGKKSVQTKSKAVKIRTLATESLPIEFKSADFYVYDENGKIVNLSDNAGKPIIVNIWATWCGPCIRELPHFDKFYAQYGDKIQFLMVNCEERDSAPFVREFLKEYGYSFPVLYDFDGSANWAYGTGYIPVTVAINRNGEIIYHDSGSLDESSLKNLIEEVLK